jgi:hypothetical protein
MIKDEGAYLNFLDDGVFYPRLPTSILGFYFNWVLGFGP